MIGTDFEQLNLKGMTTQTVKLSTESQEDKPSMMESEFYQAIRGNDERKYGTRLAYLEKRDKVLTDLEVWLDMERTRMRTEMRGMVDSYKAEYKHLSARTMQIEFTQDKIKQL